MKLGKKTSKVETFFKLRGALGCCVGAGSAVGGLGAVDMVTRCFTALESRVCCIVAQAVE